MTGFDGESFYHNSLKMESFASALLALVILRNLFLPSGFPHFWANNIQQFAISIKAMAIEAHDPLVILT